MNGPAVLTHLITLSDPVRIRLLAVLERQELAVSELCEVLQLPQSTVSRHLKTLADDGWVASRREGTSRLYSVTDEDRTHPSRQLWKLVRSQVSTLSGAAQDAARLERVLTARRETSRAFFSSAAGQWDRLRDDLFGAGFQAQSLLTLIEPSLVVADLGCGTGRAAELLAPYVARVFAIDASSEMLRAARARLAPHANVTVESGTLEALPLADASVDAAYLTLVLHHVSDPAAVLSEAARILKPGGRVVITDMAPHDREEYRQQMGHVWLGFSEKKLAQFVTAAHLADLRIVPLTADAKARGPALFTAVALRPIVSGRDAATSESVTRSIAS